MVSLTQKKTYSPVLRLEGLRKDFTIGAVRKKTVHVINGIDLEIGSEEVVALVGESGSGKTTVARLIARLYAPSSGRIMLDSQEVPRRLGRRKTLEYRKTVQMIFQDPYASLNMHHPVRYAVERPLKIHRMTTRGGVEPRMQELLEECGLKPAGSFLRRYPHELSGGQMQRVGIARALAVKPKLILADEPTSMLDVSIRLDIMNLLLDLKEKEKVSYLFITHDLAGARYVSDRIAIMYAGFILEIGPSNDVIADPKHPYTQLLKSAAPKPESGLEPERVEVGGEVPDLTMLPAGCPFEPRCRFARPECREALPEMRRISADHFVRCVLYPDTTTKQGDAT